MRKRDIYFSERQQYRQWWFSFDINFMHGEIFTVRIKKYNPFGEFGGWGIRRGKGGINAYTVSGKLGLEFILKDGRKILIGTNQPDYLKAVLIKLGKMEQTNNG